MKAVAIVPAYDEEKTVASVVTALLKAGVFFSVTVVDDGSSDKTADAARSAGAAVVRLEKNGGKGAAMLAGIAAAGDAGVLAFFDADLRGFTPAHARAIVEPVMDGVCAMNVGLRDRGKFFTAFSKLLPRISGERAMRAEVAQAVPERYWRGFKIELGFNAVCARRGWRVGTTVMSGAGIRTKLEKVGLIKGCVGYVKMFWQLAAAYVETRSLKK